MNKRINDQEVENLKKEVAKLEEDIVVQLREELKSTKTAL